MAITVGILEVILSANARQFEAIMSKAEARITKVSKKMEAIGRGLTRKVTAPIVAIAGASVFAFAKFDDAMTQSLAIMDNVSDEMKADMESLARTMAKKGIISATDLAKSYFYLASAGKDAEQSMSLLGIVEKFATAGRFDMALATDLLTDAQSALGLSSKDIQQDMINMTRLSDVLVRANTLANATVLQFSKSLTTKAAAALKTLNKDVEEGVAVLAAFADQGIKGELAGEKLYIILRDVQRASEKNTKAWDKLGMSVYDATGKILPIVDIIEQLENKFKGMSDRQKKTTATMLGFQDRSFAAMQTLIGTSKQIREYERKLRKAGGTTEKVAKKQLQSFISQMKILWHRIQDVAISLGTMLAPHIIKLSEKIKGLIKRWEKLDDRTKKYIIRLALIAAAVGPALLIIAKLMTAISLMIPLLSLIGGKAMAVFTIIKIGGFAALAPFAILAAKILAVVAVIALVTDAFLEMTGVGSLGILNVVKKFEIGGVKIGKYIAFAVEKIVRFWKVMFLYYKIQVKMIVKIVKFLVFIFTGFGKWLSKHFGWIGKMMYDVFWGLPKMVWEVVKTILKLFVWLGKGILKAIGWVAVKVGLIDQKDITALEKALTDLVKGPGEVIKKQTKILDKYTKKVKEAIGLPTTKAALAAAEKAYQLAVKEEKRATLKGTYEEQIDALLAREAKKEAWEKAYFEHLEKMATVGPVLVKEAKKEAKKGIKEKDITEVGDTFQQISLKRFALEGPGGLARVKRQEVKAPGTEELLKIIIEKMGAGALTPVILG